MFYFIVALILIGTANSQYQSASVDTSESARNEVLYPAARLHYVNIGPLLAGDYKFGYDTGKGPMGQSFREETRFADGTVKGSYGLIDENGQKGIVHYSAGKSLAAADIDSRLSTTPFTTQRQSKIIRQENVKSNPQLPVFKPSNYLQSRVVYPLNMESLSLETQGERIPLNEPKFVDSDKKSSTVYKLPTPSQLAKNMSPVYTAHSSADMTSSVIKTQASAQPAETFSVHMLPTTAERNDIPPSNNRPTEFAQPIDVLADNRLQTPAYRTNVQPTVSRIPGSVQRIDIVWPDNGIHPARQVIDTAPSVSKTPVPSQTVLSSVSQAQTSAAAQVKNSMAALAEMYKSLKRVPKKPSPSKKNPRIQKKTKQGETKSYETKFEEDYYDSAPGFIDFERLSYNIGKDRSSSV